MVDPVTIAVIAIAAALKAISPFKSMKTGMQSLFKRMRDSKPESDGAPEIATKVPPSETKDDRGIVAVKAEPPTGVSKDDSYLGPRNRRHHLMS